MKKLTTETLIKRKGLLDRFVSETVIKGGFLACFLFFAKDLCAVTKNFLSEVGLISNTD